MSKLFPIYLFLLSVFTPFSSLAQLDEDLSAIISFAKAYNLDKELQLKSYSAIKGSGKTDFTRLRNFLQESSKNQNEILQNRFLVRPDTELLDQLYLLRRVFWNINRKLNNDNLEFLKEYMLADVSENEKLSVYYRWIFSNYINTHRPFDMSEINFDLDAYELHNEDEKAIFFLECMIACGPMIHDFLNMIKPPDKKSALKNIKKFPSFNGQPYYTYTNLDLSDFDQQNNFIEERGSYKSYMIGKYYDLLLGHNLCLKKNTELTQKSLLSKPSFFIHSKYQPLLQNILKEMPSQKD